MIVAILKMIGVMNLADGRSWSNKENKNCLLSGFKTSKGQGDLI